MASSKNRGRIKVGAAVAVATAVALGVGIGTADAGTRRFWPGAQKPKPSPTVSASVTPSPSATKSPAATQSPKATKSPSVTPTATAKASSTPVKTSAAPTTAAPTATKATGKWTPPPANAGFDYQLGGAYTPPAGVTVVTRDSEASAAKGLYNICYVNAFQAQPGADAWWKTNHPDLLLRDAKGNYVIDKVWKELMLDFSTEAKRAALTTIAGGWMNSCATKGFQAAEFDNLDSYTRSGGLLTEAQAKAYATSLVKRAHDEGLAAAQKNTAELSTADARTIGFDFAVAEECGEWDECDTYMATYGNNVFVIEYKASEFDKACREFGDKLSIVLRDMDVTAPGSKSYVYKSC